MAFSQNEYLRRFEQINCLWNIKIEKKKYNLDKQKLVSDYMQ